MKLKILAAVAAALIGVSSTAMASYTYELELDGTSTSTRDLVFLPGGGTNQDGPVVITSAYDGTIQVTLPSDADGTYFGQGIELVLDLGSNFALGDGKLVSTWEHEVEVTVVDGVITNLMASYGSVFERWSILGDDVVYRANTNHDSFSITASISAVPEPASAALLCVGLAALALRRRRLG